MKNARTSELSKRTKGLKAAALLFRESGQTLIEIMITVAISGVIIAGGVSIVVTLMNETKRLEAKSGIQEFRQNVIDLIVNDVAFKNTYDNSATMTCLKNGTSCTGQGGLVTLHDRAGQVFYDSVDVNAGFTAGGVPCPTGAQFVASPAPGNSACPYRLELRWQPICDPPSCTAPQVLFIGELKVNGASNPINSAGQTANTGIRIVRNSAVRPIEIIDIQSALWTTCAVFSEGGDGRVKCWGRNDKGLLGRTTGAPQDPVANFVVDTGGNPLRDIKQVAMNDQTACAVRGDGNVLCWGNSWMGVLGRGGDPEAPEFNATSAAPVLTEVDASGTEGVLTGIVELYALRTGFCGRTAANRIFCWGASYQLDTHFPAKSPWPPSPNFHQNWKRIWSSVAGEITSQIGTPFTSFFAHETNMCVILANKEVSCWGSNQYGQLAYTPTNSEYLCPAPPGQPHCGKQGKYGPLPGRRIPAVGTMYDPASAMPAGFSALGNVKSMAGGRMHLCALLESGEVVCWGYNPYGQTGSGSYPAAATPSGSDVPECLKPTPYMLTFLYGASPRFDVKFIWENCADPSPPNTNGDAAKWSWEGREAEEDVGQGPPLYVASPTGTGRLTNIVHIDSQLYHTCAVNSAGEVYCWGLNTEGQLGTGATSTGANPSSPYPVKATAFPATKKAKKVTTGMDFTCALTDESEVYCWGGGWAAQNGNPSLTDALAGIRVQGLDLTP